MLAEAKSAQRARHGRRRGGAVDVAGAGPASGCARRDNAVATAAAMAQAVELNPNFAFGARPARPRAQLLAAAPPRRSPASTARCGSARARFSRAPSPSNMPSPTSRAANTSSASRSRRRRTPLRPGHPYPMVIGAACAGFLGDAATAAALVTDLKALCRQSARLGREDRALRHGRGPQAPRRGTGARRAGVEFTS